jgi:predicted metalloprotease with PDZ domain
VTEEARRLGLEIRESDGIGRSDNISFYNKKVPALHFFTGNHADYHRPSDTWEKLNYEGMNRIAELVLATARRIADATEPLQFVALPSRPPGGGFAGETPPFTTYLGSIPDYHGDGEGVRLAGVSPGSPAALAGLREGDVITEFAGAKIHNIEDLMAQLGAKRAGDEVEIVILRASLRQTLKATLSARN